MVQPREEQQRQLTELFLTAHVPAPDLTFGLAAEARKEAAAAKVSSSSGAGPEPTATKNSHEAEAAPRCEARKAAWAYRFELLVKAEVSLLEPEFGVAFEMSATSSVDARIAAFFSVLKRNHATALTRMTAEPWKSASLGDDPFPPPPPINMDPRLCWVGGIPRTSMTRRRFGGRGRSMFSGRSSRMEVFITPSS
jgi:hypothetical protein